MTRLNISESNVPFFKNSSRTSLTAGKRRALQGNGLMVMMANVTFLRWGLDLATARTMGILLGTLI